MKNFQYILIGIVVVLLVGCTTKSDTYYNRQFQMIPTMYNVLYNGNLAFDQGKKELEEQYQDDYFELLAIEPVVMNDQIKLKGEENPLFDRAEEKAIKAIQKHSMVFDGKQKNRKIDDAYILLGKARYYNQRFIPALEAFNHLLTNYGVTNRRNEAIIWREKTNIQLGRDRTAVDNLEKFFSTSTNKKSNKQEQKIKRQERADAQATLAQAFINLKQYEKAANTLKKAGKLTRNKPQRGRYYFITAQLYERLNNSDSATVYFQKVIDMNRKIPRKLWIEAQAGKTRNQQLTPKELQDFVLFLEKMERQYEHKQFLDVLYFQHATVLEQQSQKKQAISYFLKSLEKNTDNNRLKEKSHERLAELYFAEKQYVDAHARYDSTLVFIPEMTLEHLYIRRKRDNLAEIATQEKIVYQTDSVLRIMKLSDEQKVTYFQKHIDSLQKINGKIANNQQITNFGKEIKISIPTQDNTFYFYSPTAIAYGKQTFVKQFGDRPLVDNWRWSSLVTSSQIAEKEQDSVKSKVLTPEIFIVQLPPQSELPSLEEKRNKALYRLGVIYFEKFEDNTLAISRLEEVLKNNPDQDLKQKSLYQLYKIYERENSPKAQIYKNQLVSQFPNSDYAQILSGSGKTNEQQLGVYYEELQKSLENQEFTRIINVVDSLKPQYKLSPTAPDWDLLRAQAQGRLEGINAYKQALERIKEEYPNSKQSKKVEELLTILNLSEKEIEFEPEQRASTWKIVYPLLSEEQLTAVKDILDENGQAYIKITEDVYDATEKWSVLHGFFTKEQALQMVDRLKSNPKNSFPEEIFVISSENYGIIQVYKNKDKYIMN